MTRRAILPAAILLTGLACLLGCLGSDNPCESPVPAGRIQGHIDVGGLTTHARLRIERLRADLDYDEYDIEPDVLGDYHRDLPAGRYIVSIRTDNLYSGLYYSEAGLVGSIEHCDTLVIGCCQAPQVIDFKLTAATVDIDLSDDLNGRDARVYLRSAHDPEQPPYRALRYDERVEVADGRITCDFPGILPADYRIQLQLEGPNENANDAESIWLPGSYDEDDAGWYTVPLDSVAQLDFTLAPTPGRIEGRVTGAWQELGLDPEHYVRAYSTDSTHQRSYQDMNGDGSFVFEYHLPAEVKLSVHTDGMMQWIGGDSYEEAMAFAVEPGQTISGIELVQCGLSATLDASGCEAEYLHLAFYDAPTRSRRYNRSVYGGGDFGLSGIPPGDYFLYLSGGSSVYGGADWRSQWYDRASSADEARTVSIAVPGEIASIDIVLEWGGRISGNVFYEPEESQTTCVLLMSADTGFCVLRYWMNSGYQAYLLRGLPDGDYRLGFVPYYFSFGDSTLPPAETIWYPVGSDSASAQMFEIRDASVFENVDFDLR